MSETYDNAVWPERSQEDARHAVVEAALHMTDERDGAGGVTVARGQFSAKWTVLDAFGEPPNEEPFVVCRHRPTHDIVGYYRTYWPHDVGEIDSLDDVFRTPEILPSGD